MKRGTAWLSADYLTVISNEMDAKRNTIQRRLILEAVKELDCHASAEQVHEYVMEKYPAISKGTVYRNMSRMADTGELLRIGSVLGVCRYDHNTHNHYHFVCDKCGRVFDVEDYSGDICQTAKKIMEKSTDGFSVTSHKITFGGLCPDCNRVTLSAPDPYDVNDVQSKHMG